MGMCASFISVVPAEIQRLREEPDALFALLYQDDDAPGAPESIDVDKAWHGLHYLFNGNAHGGDGPLAQAILGGEEIGEEMDYGPARLLDPATVAAIAQALNALDPEELKRRYDPQDMEAKQIYPDIWVNEGDHAFDYLLGYAATMKAYFSGVAARGDAVITWIG